MPFAFTPQVNTFVAANLIAGIRSLKPSARRPLTPYSQGTRVVNGDNEYISIQGGTTSSGSGPTATSGTQFDGTVQWLALGSNAVRDGDINANLYMSIGKQTEWPNPTTPPAPDLSGASQAQAKSDATAFLQVKPDNVRLGIKNNAWTTGTIYSQFDPSIDQSTYPTPNYVIVDQTFVYKCLDNNNGVASTVQPVGTSTNVIELSDGYIWKYVGAIAAKDVIDFGNAQFSPLPTAVGTAQPGSISTFKGLVSSSTPFSDTATIATKVIGSGNGASAAVRTTISGNQVTLTGLFSSTGGTGYNANPTPYAIAYDSAATGDGATIAATVASGGVSGLSVTTGGSGYTDAFAVIIGDGTGATANVTVSGGQITNVTVGAAGTGYTWAIAVVIPGTAGGAAPAVLAPVNGHGSDLETELQANTVLVTVRLLAALSAYIPTQSSSVDGSFRQITLISGVQGSTRNAEAYLGPANTQYATNPGNLNKYLNGSGYVLYMNNIEAIIHTATQEEVIKISITLK